MNQSENPKRSTSDDLTVSQIDMFCAKHHLDATLTDELALDDMGRRLVPEQINPDAGRNQEMLAALALRLRARPVGQHEPKIRRNAEQWLTEATADLTRRLATPGFDVPGFSRGLAQRCDQLTATFKSTRDDKAKRREEIEKLLARAFAPRDDRGWLAGLLDIFIQAGLSLVQGIQLWNEREENVFQTQTLDQAIWGISELATEAQYAVTGLSVVMTAARDGLAQLALPGDASGSVALYQPEDYRVSLGEMPLPDGVANAVLAELMQAKPSDPEDARKIITQAAAKRAADLLPGNIVAAIEAEAGPGQLRPGDDPILLVGDKLLRNLFAQPLHLGSGVHETRITFCQAPSGQPILEGDGVQTVESDDPWKFAFVQWVSGFEFLETCSEKSHLALEEELRKHNVFVLPELFKRSTPSEQQVTAVGHPSVAKPAAVTEQSGNHSDS